MRTRIVSDLRFYSQGFLCRAGVIVKDWDAEPEVVHWSDKDGLHVDQPPEHIYRDMVEALKRQGLEN